MAGLVLFVDAEETGCVIEIYGKVSRAHSNPGSSSIISGAHNTYGQDWDVDSQRYGVLQILSRRNQLWPWSH